MNFKYIVNGWILTALTLILALTTVSDAQGLIPYWVLKATQTDNLASLGQVHMVDYRQIQCVSTAIYYESHGEPLMGQIAVARVIQNRVRQHFAATACEVVTQRANGVCQFSWACGSYHQVNAKECRQCWQIAVQVFAQHQYQAFMPNAAYFHSVTVNPEWHGLRRSLTIGQQQFYSRR